jgi:hypothetical protein
MTESSQDSEGAVIIGADGSTYFVPNSDLDAYRVPDEAAEAFHAELENEPEVSGFTFKKGSTDFGGLGDFQIVSGKTKAPDPRQLSAGDTIVCEFKRD